MKRRFFTVCLAISFFFRTFADYYGRSRFSKRTSMQDNAKYWTTTITSHDRLMAVDCRELWRYRDLFLLFVRRNITTQYKQTVLGPLWFLINPILSVIVYMVVFGGIAGMPTDGAPPALFYLLGVAVWNYFQACVTATSNAFVENANIFGKVYFPRLIMPLVSVTTQLVNLGVQLLLFAVVYLFYAYSGEAAIHTTWGALALPLLILMLAMLAMGFGMIISSVTTKYRDLQLLMSQIVSLWMYLTPVIYPLSMVTNPTLHTLMSLNPVTPLMETFKYCLLGVGDFSWPWLLYSLGVSLLLFFLGLLFFQRTQKSFLDTV